MPRIVRLATRVHQHCICYLKSPVDCPFRRTAIVAPGPRPHLDEIKFGSNRHVISSSSSSSSSSLRFAANPILAPPSYTLEIMRAQGAAAPYCTSHALTLLGRESAGVRGLILRVQGSDALFWFWNWFSVIKSLHLCPIARPQSLALPRSGVRRHSRGPCLPRRRFDGRSSAGVRDSL